MPTYSVGDRVLLRTATGEYPATLAAVDALTTDMPIYLIEPDPDTGAQFPRIIAGPSFLRPLDDSADVPLIVGG